MKKRLTLLAAAVMVATGLTSAAPAQAAVPVGTYYSTGSCKGYTVTVKWLADGYGNVDITGVKTTGGTNVTSVAIYLFPSSGSTVTVPLSLNAGYKNPGTPYKAHWGYRVAFGHLNPVANCSIPSPSSSTWIDR